MTLLLTRPSDPIQGPDRPWPNPSTPPQLAEPYPRPEPSNPTPYPPPRPNISLRIGRPPSLPRRHRVKRTVRWVWRHAGNVVVYWLAMTGAMVATVYGGVRLVVAVMPHAQAPLNFTEWTVAIVAVGTLLAAHLLGPRPKKSPVQRRDSSPALGGGVTAPTRRNPVRRVGVLSPLPPG